MCGIVGVVAACPLPEHDTAACASAVDTLAHRGPDDRGMYGSPGRTALLGHRRLSIIDLAGGQQPLTDEQGRRQLVYNGEIYNYRALRRELTERGHVLRTATDGEPIVHLHEDDPDGFLARLQGMFALAIYDPATARLTLARDRLGIKPLYFACEAGRLIFASELKALRPLLARPPALSAAGLREYLRWKYIPAPLTIYRDVYELPAGCRLDAESATADAGIRWRVRRYWAPAYPDGSAARISDEAAAAAELDERLNEVVAAHLEADVEVGALLSGGVDSSLVVALAGRHSRRPIRTFSVGFREPGFDQLPFARRLAEHCRTVHHEELVALDPLAALPRLVRAFDQPFADSSALASDLVCQAAARHVKVVLTGDGGDEAFAGYQRYQALAGDEPAGAAPGQGVRGRAWLRRAAFSLGAAVLSPEAKPLQKLRYAELSPLERFAQRELTATDYLLRKLLRPAWGAPGDQGPGPPMLFTPGEQGAGPPILSTPDEPAASGFEPAALPPGMYPAYHELEDAARVRGWSRLSMAQFADVTTYLPGDILTKVDRTSMAWSLECRPPLLDHTIVEFSTRLTSELLLGGGVGKRLLKRVAERYVPPDLLYRKKRGFRVPLRRWFKGSLLAAAEARLDRGALVTRGVLEAGGVRGLSAAQRRPWINLSSLLWALLFLEEWTRASPEWRA